MVSFSSKASYFNMFLSVVQNKREIWIVFTFTVLVVWSWARLLMEATHGSFKVGASTICADLWFQAGIHPYLKECIQWKKGRGEKENKT